MKRKIKNKKTIILFFLAFLLAFGLSFSISSLAKYSTLLSDIEDYKTVASWDVSTNLPDASIDLNALDGEGTYTLTITNNSDVSAKYSIVVSNIPTGTLVALDSKAYQSSTGSVTFNNVGTINVNEVTKTKTHTIKFKTVPEAAEVSNRNVKIQVNFEQINPQ